MCYDGSHAVRLDGHVRIEFTRTAITKPRFEERPPLGRATELSFEIIAQCGAAAHGMLVRAPRRAQLAATA